MSKTCVIFEWWMVLEVPGVMKMGGGGGCSVLVVGGVGVRCHMFRACK